ncbi:hypothetical protein JQ633_01075 [Bradyrhizobium tropiciagri]|uniref:hypothetical protein n=1 Tax=Bradyrhizobium tropiciagri TaxID=312253 RepID=UPI001BAE18D6|nr:hypothetical protein [Bradyrhizobium tropiciagri]MBR0868933.1 hypothetical protein [Bradyrhizobium tropiciagri]
MADIDSIISGAGGSTRADFSNFDPVKAFFDASKQRADFDTRRAFRDGVPTDASGQPDFGAIAGTFFKKGAINEGLAATKMGLEQQRLKYGADMAQSDFPSAGSPQPAPLPPSANRAASVPVAPSISGGAAAGGRPAVANPAPTAPRGDQPGSIVGLVSGAGVPDELAGPIIAQVSAATRLDPNATVRPDMTPRVQQIVAEAVRRSAADNQPRPVPQPPAAPAAPAQAAPTDPTLGGLVPAGRTPQQQLDLLSRRVASGLLAPEVAKSYETRIKAIQDALQPTQDMKNAAASGLSLQDYQNRSDENTAQRDIMTKSLLPRVDQSQEKASAARDDINSIHAAREQLDAQGGVFSGTLADKKLALGKIYAMLGGDNSKVANTESYGAAIGQRVASMVKAFGSGTAISDSDRKFASAMAGGNITLDESSMRRILDIGEKAARAKIVQHNQFVDKIVGANEALKPARDSFLVTAPGDYKKPSGSTAAISSRADYDKLPSGATFVGPDGKQWRKP